uniref:Uncharacterized protein n=1 Tax=Glossina pallidipes TaxID=7398 RepID=A0A1B0AG01_GLOPL
MHQLPLLQIVTKKLYCPRNYVWEFENKSELLVYDKNQIAVYALFPFNITVCRILSFPFDILFLSIIFDGCENDINILPPHRQVSAAVKLVKRLKIKFTLLAFNAENFANNNDNNADVDVNIQVAFVVAVAVAVIFAIADNGAIYGDDAYDNDVC